LEELVDDVDEVALVAAADLAGATDDVAAVVVDEAVVEVDDVAAGNSVTTADA
jgi:hypothetical protein